MRSGPGRARAEFPGSALAQSSGHGMPSTRSPAGASLHFTADPEANRLLARGAARGAARHAARPAGARWSGRSGTPLLLKQRLGAEDLDATAIAAMDPARARAVFRDKPTLHRYPASMAKRTHDLCRLHRRHYDGQHRGDLVRRELGERVAGRACRRCPASARTSRASSSACSASGSACAAGLGAGRRRLGLDRRCRLVRPRRRDPREEAPRPRPRRRPPHRRRRTRRRPRRRSVSSGCAFALADRSDFVVASVRSVHRGRGR